VGFASRPRPKNLTCLTLSVVAPPLPHRMSDGVSLLSDRKAASWNGSASDALNRFVASPCLVARPSLITGPITPFGSQASESPLSARATDKNRKKEKKRKEKKNHRAGKKNNTLATEVIDVRP